MKKITIEVESDPGMPPAIPEGYDPIRFGRPQKGEPWTDGHGEVYFVGPNGQYDPNRAVLILRPKQPRRFEVEVCPVNPDGHIRKHADDLAIPVRIVREILPEAATGDMKLDMGESLRGRETAKEAPVWRGSLEPQAVLEASVCPQCGADDPNEPRINFALKKICDHTFHPLNKPKRTSVHPNDELCVCGHRLGIHHPNKGSCAAGNSRVESGCVCCNCPLFKSAETGTGAKRKVVKFTFLRRGVPGIGDWIPSVAGDGSLIRVNEKWGIVSVDIYQRTETEE